MKDKSERDLKQSILDIFTFTVAELTGMAEGTVEGKPTDPKAMKCLSTVVSKLASAIITHDVKQGATQETTKQEVEKQERPVISVEADDKLQCPECPRKIAGKGPLAAHIKHAHARSRRR